jgi:hypothetical protein
VARRFHGGPEAWEMAHAHNPLGGRGDSLKVTSVVNASVPSSRREGGRGSGAR